MFKNSFQITGLTPMEAHDLALLLRAGALAAPVYPVDERTIGPSLGHDNIERGFSAIKIGFLAVIVFMAIYYRAFGLIANVERIREELSAGASPQAAIDSGYGKALSSITDANVTTLIAAVVLFALGTGPIKGFAITLLLGIITSMFTAIIGTRTIVNLVFGGRKLQSLPV